MQPQQALSFDKSHVQGLCSDAMRCLQGGIRRTLGLVLVLAAAGSSSYAAPIFYGPTPYLAFDNSVAGAGGAISPFAGLSFDYFHLEDFEDHALNVPGVTSVGPSPGLFGVTSIASGTPNIIDSVDGDDGDIDGSGLDGDSYFASPGSAGIRFNFSAAVLGNLPTHVGIVWTDGLGDITFSVFGPAGTLVGTFGPISGIPDSIFTGQTAEDRFLGVVNREGISAIFINNSEGGMEVDHLQYGFQAAAAVPEPTSAALWSIAGVGLAVARYRRDRRRCAAAT